MATFSSLAERTTKQKLAFSETFTFVIVFFKFTTDFSVYSHHEEPRRRTEENTRRNQAPIF